MKADKTKVIFRKFRGLGDVIAIFPELPGTNDNFTCMSYQHIGQHGACTPDTIISITTPVDERYPEYRDLKKELESLGYDLQVCKRLSIQMYVERTQKGKVQ
jgi:hypothetical protein